MRTEPARDSRETALLEEREILQQVRLGRPEGFRALVERYYPAVIGLLRFLGAPEAMIDDVTQESFLKAYQHLGRFDPMRPFRPWLLSIARNTLTDMLRKQGRECLSATPMEQAQPGCGVEETVISGASAAELLEALSPEARFLIEMRVIYGHSFAEIAEMTGTREGTLRMRFHRILEQMRLQPSAERGRHG